MVGRLDFVTTAHGRGFIVFALSCSVLTTLLACSGGGGDDSKTVDGSVIVRDGSFSDAFAGWLDDIPPVAPPDRRPYAFQQDEVAPPGRYVSMCGRLLGNPPTVRLYRVDGREPVMNERYASTADAVTASSTCVQFRIPVASALGLFAVWLRNRDDLSSIYYLNRARPYYVEYESAFTGTRVRIFGVNLRLPGATPTVRLVTDDAALDAEVDVEASNENVLVFVMPPNLTNGTAYTVRISNGYGGSFGEVDAGLPLRARTIGNGDRFGFNVPWAGDFDYTQRASLSTTGDVQAAIDDAESFGGGVVRLEPGSYSGFTLRTGVLVKGPDPGRGVATINGSIGWYGASRAGIVDLTVSSTSSWGNTEPAQEKLVIHRVRSTHDHAGNVFTLRAPRHVLISDWTQSVRASAGHPLDVAPFGQAQPQYIHIRGYRPTFIHHRLNVVNARFVTIERSISTRDFNLGYIADDEHDSGHWNLELTHDATFLDSTIRAIGDVAMENDGEGWSSQGSSQHERYPPYFGNASGGSTSTLEHEGTSFPRVNADSVEYWAFLIDGVGAGQARRVTGTDGATLRVTPSWDVPPANGSRYIVLPLCAHQVLVRGCTMQDNSRNLWMYSGGYDVTIVDNRLRNGEMWLRAFEQEDGGSGATEGSQVYPMWKSYVARNQLSTTSGDAILDGDREYNRTSHVMLTFGASEASGGDYSGMYMLINSIVDNRVNAWPLNRSYDPPLTEGIHVSVNDQSEESATRGKAGRDPDTNPIVGVVIQGNAVDEASTAYITGSGVRHVVIADRRGNAMSIENASDPGVRHGATDLVMP